MSSITTGLAGRYAIALYQLATEAKQVDDIFAGKVEEPMNLGNERSLEDYALLSGIDLKNNTVLDLEKATESNFLESLDWKISPLKQ